MAAVLLSYVEVLYVSTCVKSDETAIGVVGSSALYTAHSLSPALYAGVFAANRGPVSIAIVTSCSASVPGVEPPAPKLSAGAALGAAVNRAAPPAENESFGATEGVPVSRDLPEAANESAGEADGLENPALVATTVMGGEVEPAAATSFKASAAMASAGEALGALAANALDVAANELVGETTGLPAAATTLEAATLSVGEADGAEARNAADVAATAGVRAADGAPAFSADPVAANESAGEADGKATELRLVSPSASSPIAPSDAEPVTFQNVFVSRAADVVVDPFESVTTQVYELPTSPMFNGGVV